MSLEKWKEAFQNGMQELAQQFQLNLAPETVQKLEGHLFLLMQWNQVHNLTSVSDVGTLVSEHYADCVLALRSWSPVNNSNEPIFDLGAGNGFPGLIAAVLFPQFHFVLVESSRKKSSFLRTAVAHLDLHNVEIRNERVESLKGMKRAITRAAFSEGKIDDIVGAFAQDGELALLTVPEFPSDKWRIDESPWKIAARRDYKLPSDAKRSVVILKKK